MKKVHMLCKEYFINKTLECGDVNGVKYCEEVMIKKKACVPLHGNEFEAFKRLEAVIKGKKTS